MYTGTNELNRRYQPGSNLMTDESNYLLADSHTIFSHYFIQIEGIFPSGINRA